jgi:hypothetical protein
MSGQDPSLLPVPWHRPPLSALPCTGWQATSIPGASDHVMLISDHLEADIQKVERVWLYSGESEVTSLAPVACSASAEGSSLTHAQCIWGHAESGNCMLCSCTGWHNAFGVMQKVAIACSAVVQVGTMHQHTASLKAHSISSSTPLLRGCSYRLSWNAGNAACTAPLKVFSTATSCPAVACWCSWVERRERG